MACISAFRVLLNICLCSNGLGAALEKEYLLVDVMYGFRVTATLIAIAGERKWSHSQDFHKSLSRLSKSLLMLRRLDHLCTIRR
jgi:hypothetical protein